MKQLLLVIFGACTFASFAQQNNDPVLLTVDGREIRKSEFENVYHKNNKETGIDPKSLREYLDLYINFRLKVREAEELGLDTTTAFKNELAGYRKQLSQPYLTDNEVTEQLINEAYERMKTDIRASHILVKVEPDALPKDTLAAYNKIMKARERVLKGEDFAAVARAVSDDPSAKENGGDLGYFTSMQMVYPFETMAYNTNVGEVSKPVRTRFGYHIIKVHDRRPARGQILVSHIMVSTQAAKTAQDSAAARAKINELYARLQKGESFEELAKQFSDDKASAVKGGQLQWFGTGRMVPEFEKAAYNLKEKGEISAPVQSRFGWHIIKKLDEKELAPFEQQKAEIKTRISKDSRAEKTRESLINRIKKENSFKENLKARDEMARVIDKSFFEGTWTAEKAQGMNATLFTFGNKNYTQQDFAKYLQSHQVRQPQTDARAVINRHYKNFVDESAIAYQDSQLENKHPEFRALMQEYRDGILLFELTDQKVWSKAVKDTLGLEEYYNRNKNNFMWDERVDATIYTAANEDIAEKTRKMVKKAKKKGYTKEDILKEINEDSQLNLKIESGKYTRGENEIIDKIVWAPGLTGNIKKDNQVVFVEVHQKLAPEPKSLKEARGLVTAEYQAHLEKEWIDELRKKYKVTVNEEVLRTIK